MHRRIQEDIVKSQHVELSIEVRILFPWNYLTAIPGILIVHVSVLTKDFHHLRDVYPLLFEMEAVI